MTKSIHGVKVAIFLLVILLFSAVSFAQSRAIQINDFYGDIKTALTLHYTGKLVKVKMTIPATRRGLEMIDGTLQNSSGPTQTPPPAAAQPGDELVIKSLRIGDNEIEFEFGKNEPPPKKSLSSIFSIAKPPRINLRFSRELTTKDLTIENINRMLATAVDVSSLTQPAAEKGASATQASIASPQAEAPAKTDEPANDQGLPSANIVGDLPSLNPALGELTVESLAQPARVYIDGSYSGIAPRTVRLRAGVHTILVVSDGHAPWEQKFFIPGGKASVVRAELSRAMK
jgi:hypothetical protein